MEELSYQNYFSPGNDDDFGSLLSINTIFSVIFLMESLRLHENYEFIKC